MITYHDADSKIMPVLLDRFPLVIPVSPGNQAVEAPLEAVLLVRDMPLVPAYRDWLAGLSHSKRWGANLTGYHILARVFSLLLVRRGFFMLFLFAFMAGRGIIAHALGGKGRPREKPEERLAAALLGGACSFILIAAVLTAMAPFSPLFLGFLAWDLAQSSMADFFVARGLYIFPGF